MTGSMVALLAAATGIAQAILLRRAVLLGPRPTGMLVRVLLVAAGLAAAAVSGWLPAGVVAWGTGFAGSALVLARRTR